MSLFVVGGAAIVGLLLYLGYSTMMGGSAPQTAQQFTSATPGSHVQVAFEVTGLPSLSLVNGNLLQKNRAVVRAFVGYDRLVGEQAYWQLRELYRAVRLYVNCFQPSMKLLDKQQEGETIRRVYDPAKTPLQRLVLSGILSADRQQEVSQVAQALDPVRLLEQVEHLQQALWHCLPFCRSFTSQTNRSK